MAKRLVTTGGASPVAWFDATDNDDGAGGPVGGLEEMVVVDDDDDADGGEPLVEEAT